METIYTDGRVRDWALDRWVRKFGRVFGRVWPRKASGGVDIVKWRGRKAETSLSVRKLLVQAEPSRQR